MKTKIELPYDLAIPLLGIYIWKKKNPTKQPKALIWKDILTSVFIAALFTIANIGKQPNCSLTDEWIKKAVVWYIYTMECFSNIKKKEQNFAISSNMHGFGGHYAKAMVFRRDGDGQASLTCCSPWGCRESDRTEPLNNDNNAKWKKSEKNKYCMMSLICGI